jgi:hypothetical protein
MHTGTIGETRRCDACGHPAIVLSREALNEVLATLSLFGAGHLNVAYGPAWICSNCGSYEAVEPPRPAPAPDLAVTKGTPQP